MKHLLYFIILLTYFSSCSNLDEPEFVSDTTHNTSQKSRLMGQTYQVLGHGYDITGNYLHPKSIKNAVFNATKYHDSIKIVAGPGDNSIYDNGSISLIYEETYFGEDAMTYIEEIKTKTKYSSSVASQAEKAENSKTIFSKIGAPFGGSINWDKDTESKTTMTSKYAYGRVDVVKEYKKYAFPSVTPNELQKHLTYTFKEDLKSNKSAKYLVETYGTHVLLDFNVGGIYSFSISHKIQTHKEYISKKDVITASTNAILSKVGVNFSATYDKTHTTDYVREQENSNIKLDIRGGKSHKENITIAGNGNITSLNYNIGDWAGEVDDTNCVLVSINLNRTHPLYEYIPENYASKREEVKQYIQTYIKSKEKPILAVKPMHELFSYNNKKPLWVFSNDDVDYIQKRWGDRYEGLIGHMIAVQNIPDEIMKTLKPMHRLKSNRSGKIWYVNSIEEVNNAKNKWGDTYEGLDGYIYINEEPSTRPMYKLLGGNDKVWYVFSRVEKDYVVSKWGDKFLGIDGYLIEP